MPHQTVCRHEVAAQNEGVVASMLHRLVDLAKNFSNATHIPDNGRFCEAVNSRHVQGVGVFLGPWID